MATVSSPISRASLAMTGEAPVPVPPPMPAVMKIIFVPTSSSCWRISGNVSTAARRPFSGSLPAPSPSAPRRIFRSTGLLSNACWSVLQTMKVTPRMPRFHMWFTALPPAPPTPTTVIIDPSVRGALISDINSSVISLFPNYPNNLNYPFSPAGKRVSAAFTNPALPQTPLLGGNLLQRSRGFSRDFDRNADERIRPKSPRPRPPRNSC